MIDDVPARRFEVGETQLIRQFRGSLCGGGLRCSGRSRS